MDQVPGEHTAIEPDSAQPVGAAQQPITAASGWQLPGDMDPSWRNRPWPRRHWRPLLFLGLVAIVVVGLFSFFSSTLKTVNDLSAGSNGRITGVNEVTTTSGTTFTIYAAVGVGPAEAVQLACDVVRPILAREGYSDARFVVLDRAGDILATQSTTCEPPTPSPNPVTLAPGPAYAG